MKINYLHIASIIVSIIGILGIVSSIEEKNEFEKGRKVVMNVIEKPFDCNSINTRNTFIKLEFKGRVYINKVGPNFCDYLEKDAIKVILSPDEQTIYFESEYKNFFGDTISGVMILFIGILCFLKSRKK